MADEIKLKAPTVEQQVVVNINGEDKLKSFADTLDKISNNKNLQRYWKTQQELINATADAYSNFQKKASKDNASELIKVTNALKAMSGTDLSHILPDFDKISKSIAEAQMVAENIDSAFSVKGFKEAFDSFETLKAYGTDIQKLFSHFGVSSDIGELQQNVRLLEGEVEKLTRRLNNARNANEELRNEFENFKIGSGFADKLDELDRLKAEMQNIRNEATQTFNQFLDANKIDRYDWFNDDRFTEYFEKLENGTLTATEAIRRFKSEYFYLLEDSYKSSGDSFGLDQLQAFSVKLDIIFHQVEETSNKINDILSEISVSAKGFTDTFKNGLNVNASVEEIEKLTNRVKELESELAKIKTPISSTPQVETNISSGLKDAFPETSDVASVEKVADGFKEVKQETEKATESAKEYSKILSQVGEYGVDRKVSAVYKRNDGQLESVNWRAKTDDNGQILYDKDGNIDYDFNMTVISKYEQLEKIIVKADDELRNLQKDLAETKNYNPTASTDNIEEKIADQKAYIQLLEQTVKVISQSDEYLMMEQQIIDARNKAAREYALTMGAKQEKSDAKKTASDEEKRLNNITQINRALNKQQILIDEIEKTYSKTANPDLDRVVSSQSDLTELANKKAEIQTLLNKLNNQGRNASNEQEFLQLEKLISEYKQLAKDKLKANNPSKQELGGQQLDVLLSQQVAQYNQLIAKAEKYGDATADIVQKLKDQRDTIAEINSDGIYTAKSGLKADDYYSARDNYKKSKAEFTSYETDIKSASNVAKQEASNIQAEWDKNIKAIQDYMDAVTKLNNLKAKDKGTGSEANQIALQTQNVEELKQAAWDARQNLSSMQAENPDIIAWKQWVDMMELFDQASKGSAESAAKLKDVLDNIKAPSLDKYESKLSSYLNKTGGYDATIARFKDGGWTSPEYLKNVRAVEAAVNKYKTLLEEIKAKGGIASEEDVQQLKEYEGKIKKTISTVSNMSASEKGYSFTSAQKELDKIHKLLNENSKMSSEVKAKIKAYYREIESGNPSMSLDKIHGEIMKIYNAEVEAGRAGRSFIDTLKNSGFHQIAAQMAGMFGVYDVINLGKEGINVVRELNTSLTEMRKVSDESLQSLKNYQNITFDTADAVGTTAKQIQASTADYMRLGESLDEAAESAKTANVLLNVSEFDNIEDATKSLVAMGQAYKDLDKMTIVDKLNEVGNNYAISTDELATALQKSAATLSLMGNTIDEAASLVTTANATIQDADSVSAGLRTISLRLVGTEEAEKELSAMNEEVDAFVKATNSKKQQIIKDYTAVASNNYQGFDILDSNGNYKNTYEINKMSPYNENYMLCA